MTVVRVVVVYGDSKGGVVDILPAVGCVCVSASLINIRKQSVCVCVCVCVCVSFIITQF